MSTPYVRHEKYHNIVSVEADAGAGHVVTPSCYMCINCTLLNCKSAARSGHKHWTTAEIAFRNCKCPDKEKWIKPEEETAAEPPMSFFDVLDELDDEGYTIQTAQGAAPVQIAGVLPSGEAFFFRARENNARLDIGPKHDRTDEETSIYNLVEDDLVWRGYYDAGVWPEEGLDDHGQTLGVLKFIELEWRGGVSSDDRPTPVQAAVEDIKRELEELHAGEPEKPKEDGTEKTYKGFCMKCQASVYFLGAVGTITNRRRSAPVAKGPCSICGTTVNRILG